MSVSRDIEKARKLVKQLEEIVERLKKKGAAEFVIPEQEKLETLKAAVDALVAADEAQRPLRDDVRKALVKVGIDVHSWPATIGSQVVRLLKPWEEKSATGT